MAVLPTPRLLGLTLGVAVVLGLATLATVALYLAVLYALVVIGAAVLDLRLAPSRDTFAVERRHEERLSPGELNPVDVTLRWLGRWKKGQPPLRLWVRDETPPGIPVDRLFLDGVITPGDSWTERYHLRPLRRGDYAFGHVNLRMESPLSLFILQHSYPLAGPARVYPNLRAVRRYELLARRGRLQEVGLRHTRLIGQGTEYDRLRDYLPDDDYRRIAWKATARRFSPVTVDFETERSQVLTLVVDTGRLMGTPVGAMEKLDYVVNAALMLAYVALRRDDRVGLVAFADRIELYVPPNRGRRQFHVLLESLYKIRSQPVESDVGRALAHVAARQQRRSLVVLLTDVAEAADADDLVSHLGYLARRHLPLCVTIGDPDLTQLAAAEPGDSRRAYEKVVAQRILDERREILDHLERHGAMALDVPAERLTAEVVDRYLEIKARTLL